MRGPVAHWLPEWESCCPGAEVMCVPRQHLPHVPHRTAVHGPGQAALHITCLQPQMLPSAAAQPDT